jgi:RNA polymerase sigma factor (sigma-70 family)
MMTPSTPFAPFAPFTPFAGARSEARSRPFVRLEERLPAPSEGVRLARAAASGDPHAMRELLRALRPRIERVVRAILGHTHQEIDDVVQQAMLGVVQSLPSFRGECEPTWFASRVAARTAIAAARKGRATRARHEDGVDLDQLASGAAEPQVDAARSRRLSALRNALARIPSEQADALALRIVLGWSLGEVAEATGVPLNTVRSRLRLAKAALRALVDSDPRVSEELDDDE